MTNNQLVNFFDERLNELIRKIEGSKSPYETESFPVWNKTQRKILVDLYNLNLDLLKIFNPAEKRLRINRLR
tara:strand:+ start:451 stop:666 length:216 start_codon:yes stop_codon:yes gene_type:complete